MRLYFDRTKEASNITQRLSKPVFGSGASRYSMEDLVLLTQEEDRKGSRPMSSFRISRGPVLCIFWAWWSTVRLSWTP